MDRQKLSDIGHHGLPYACPVNPEKFMKVIELMRLGAGQRVVDIGCGNGVLLLRVAERFGVSGVGVDAAPPRIAAACENARRYGIENVAFEAGEASAYLDLLDLETTPAFDAAICIASSHALGGYRATLRRLRERVRPGGVVLMGEGYWRQPPPAAYLMAIDGSADEMDSHAGNVATATSEGFALLYATASSTEEWDHYEGMYLFGIETWCHEHPDDPDVPAFLRHIRSWRDAYYQWGRDTMGFALYMLRRS